MEACGSNAGIDDAAPDDAGDAVTAAPPSDTGGADSVTAALLGASALGTVTCPMPTGVAIPGASLGGVDVFAAGREVAASRPDKGGALTVGVESTGPDAPGLGAGTVGAIIGFAGGAAGFGPREGGPASGGSVSADDETWGCALGRGALTAGASEMIAGGADEEPIARASIATARLNTTARSFCPVALADSAACRT
jgi:hypothetical protein